MNESPAVGCSAARPPLRSLNERRRGRVLIVDESRLIRSVFTGALAGLYDCTTVTSCEGAAHRLKHEEFDLMIADMVTAGSAGTQLLESIAYSHPSIQVIMLSTAETSSDVDSLPIDVADRLIKPCDIRVLQTAVANAFDRRRNHEAEKCREFAWSSDPLVSDTTAGRRLSHCDVREMEAVGLDHFLTGTAIELQKTVDLIEGNLRKLRNELQLQGPYRLSSYDDEARSTLAQTLNDCLGATTQLLGVLKIFTRFAFARRARYSVPASGTHDVRTSSQRTMY